MKPQLTENGHEQLKNKLAMLRQDRMDAREHMRTARKFCDFREDVTYNEMVRDIERIEANLLKIEHLLDEATIVESEQSQVGVLHIEP